ncbi:MAG TPA: ATP-binding protein [Verrucomicrobiae bacterium]|nr:ATP-binding protein [Verrucomicrobiae bacterium]
MYLKFTFLLLVFSAGVSNLYSAEVLVRTETPVRKVVRQYALTSANDFLQRDPQDWRLLASNDGGRTWATLDVRAGEGFSERHQRRVFSIANTNAFNLYRLQIDRVREPKAANSVQLAELELIGEDDNGSSMPILADVISAQGDNPPLESVAQLFDGQVETKWLDRPANRTTCASWVQWQYVRPVGITVTNIAQLVALRGRASEGYVARLAVVYAGESTRSGFVELLDNTGALEIPAPPELLACRPAQRVTIDAITAVVEGEPSVTQCRVQVADTAIPKGPRKVILEEPLEEGENFIWAEVEGEIQRVQDNNGIVFLEIADGERQLPIRLRRTAIFDPSLQPGISIRARGIVRAGFDVTGRWVASSLWAAGPEAIAPLENEEASARSSSVITKPRRQPLPGITRIGEIRALSQQVLASRPHVTVRGVITGLIGAFVQDDTGGIQVAFKPEDSRRLRELGQYVEVVGWLGLSDASTPIISADRVTVLGPGRLPNPEQPHWESLASGREDSVWVEMQGVVRATDGAHLLTNCDGRQVTASLGAAAAPLVNQLVDASVRIRGVAVAALDDWGRMRGVHVLIPSLEYLDVERNPDPPFSQPVQPVRNLLKAGGAGTHAHRVRVAGVLTFQDGQRLFLQDETGAAMAIFKQEVALDSKFGRSQWSFWRTPSTPAAQGRTKRFMPGDLVEVVGFQDSHGYSPVLTEALVRRVGSRGDVAIREISDTSFVDWKLDAMLVRLQGSLVGQQVRGEQVVLELVSHGRTVQAFMPAGFGELQNLAAGSGLEITGIWQMDPVPYAELGRSVGAVRVLTRSPADVLVRSRPSWWTVQRALTVVGGMAFVLAAASVWITQLHRKVEERTAQLASEIHKRERTEKQRALEEERSRIARDLHDDLGAALTQIRFLSAIESRDVAVPSGTRSRLEQVSEKSRQLVASLDEIVWAINPANDSLANLASYLCHVAVELFATTPIRCRLDVEESLPPLSLTTEVRHNVYLAVREALNNVAKHSKATEAWFKLRCRDNVLEISVEDNGQGIQGLAAVDAGEGLRNMRQRMESAGGHFACESRENSGTVCRMSLPLLQTVAANPTIANGNGNGAVNLDR